VITSAPNDQIIVALRERGLPIVGVEHEVEFGSPLVRGHDRAIGALACEHLRQLGYRRFTFYGGGKSTSERERRGGFCDAVTEAGLEYVDILKNGSHEVRQSSEFLLEWLRALPKPIAIFCHYTLGARRLVISARDCGVAVPEEVSILGLENDDLLCRANRPSISSVDQGLHRIGHEAARILDEWLAGKQPPTEPVLVEPGGVIQRRTTSFYAIEDPLVSRAMRYIWERACEGIQVGEVVEHVNCSRRGLEVRFKKSIGRSIGSEIGRARISHARTLLTETKLSLAEIAQACGYQWQAQFTKVFRQIAGETPSAYRKRLLSSS
jgi:LacI family transcriptional regulator